jgi:outer membrane protein insertion porin family
MRLTAGSWRPVVLLLGLLLPHRAPAESLPRVVVAGLPFRIHSEKPLGYLEQSLADLLATRLEKSGRVEVVDAVVVREAAVEYAAGELGDEAVTRIARELGADYTVIGSLTELAGQFSLDVRVAPANGGAPARSIVVTAEGEDALLDRINELADRVIEHVSRAGDARAVVKSVDVLGGDGSERAWLEKLETRPGRPYDSAAVQRDLDTLRKLPGVATANVETQREPEGVVVRLRLVRAERLGGEARDASPTERVGEVRIRGNQRIEADAIRARIKTKAGDAYSKARVAEDLREVHALGFFRDVRVLGEDGLDGRVLTFEVEENPVVRRISIEGNDEVGTEKIRDALTLTTGSTLDYPLLYENRERVKALYRAEGFHLADVKHEIEPLQNNAVGIHFQIAEGKKLRLEKIAFEGNEHFDDDALSRGMKTKRWRPWSYVTQYLDKSGTYAEPVFLQDLRGVEQKYMDAGYLHVDIGEPDVVPIDDGLEVRVRIAEGDRFKVGKLDVAGDATVDLEALREKLALKEGEWFNRSALTGDVETLTGHYTDRGFWLAQVNPRTELLEKDKAVDVVFEVEKGNLYFVRGIDFAGNTTTVDPVLRREMQTVEGELYSARALGTSERRIKGLGFFEEVNFEPKPTDVPGQVDLGVKVVEKPTGSLSFGAGFSSTDKFVVTGNLSQTNLFGRGYGVQLAVDIGGSYSRYLASFTDPYLFGSEWSFSSALFKTDVEYTDFENRETGLDLALGHALDEDGRSRGFVRYSYSSREVIDDSGVNAASVIFRELISQSESSSILGLTFRTDTRDDPLSPTTGWMLAGGAELAGLGGFSKFIRFEGRVSRFLRAPSWFPIYAGRSTFVATARAGYVFPFNTIADFDLPDIPSVAGAEFQPLVAIDTDLELPLTERYFLGGLGTYQLRGFKARSVGPRRAILKRTGLFGTGNLFMPVGRELAQFGHYEEIEPDPDDPENQLDNPLGDEGGTPSQDRTSATQRFVVDGIDAVCNDVEGSLVNNQGDGDGKCNSLYTTDVHDFEDLDETDVIGGNKFMALNLEYRFPISEEMGLVGVVFFDAGNSFAENESLFDVGNWRYGTGVGVQWFSPFGPLQAFWGVPLNPLEVEDSNVFEFSMGGDQF